MAELFSKHHPGYLNISVSMMCCVLDNCNLVCLVVFNNNITKQVPGAFFDVFMGLISIKVTGKT